MKRILSLFATFGLILGTSISVISCNKSNKKEEKENFVIIQKFKKEVEKIYNEHISSREIRKKLLIFLSDNKPNNEKYEFFNKDNINDFSNGKENKLTAKEKKLLKNDIYKILGINNLKENLEKLKDDDDFEKILKGIDLISDANILYDNDFKINLDNIINNENNNEFFCNIIFNYKIDISYRNNKNIENISFISNHKIVCTNNEILIDMCNKFNENVARDLFLDKEIKELLNFCWIGKKSIKNNNKDYEGYGNFSNNIKEYINNENQKADLEKVIKFIKEKYFKSKDSNLSINIVLDENKKEEICIKTQFDDNFINVFENKNSKQFVRYYDDDTNSKNMFNAIFRDKEKGDNIKTLKDLYFHNKNIETWNEEFLKIKDNYLKSKFDLRIDDIDKINKWDQYKHADSIGKITIDGLNLEISYKENKPFYLDLNRFDLHVIYNVIDENVKDKYIENKSKLLSEFTSKNLIKNFQDFFGIFNENKNYPEYNSTADYFVNISNKAIIEFLENKKDYIETETNFGGLINLFYCLNFYDYQKREPLIKYKEEILKNVISLISKNKLKNNYFLYYDYSNKTDENITNNKYEDDCHEYRFSYFNNEINWKIDIKEGVLMERNKKYSDKNPDAITFKLGYLAVSIKYEKLFKLETLQNNRMFIKFIKN